MGLWIQQSDKDADTAFVGAEHKGVAGFAELRVDKRGLLHALSAVSAALALWRRLKWRREAESMRRSTTLRAAKAPRRGTFGGKRGK